jgi:O-antigen ligase
MTGMQAALGIAIALALGYGRTVRWRWLLVSLALSVATLWASGSRTATLAALAAVAVYLWRVRPWWAVAAGCLLLLAALGSFAWNVDSTTALERVSRSGDADEIYQFTGRVEIWSYVVDKIRQSPLVGYGYSCSRFAMAEFNAGVDELLAVYHAHNMLLNVAMGTGLPGGMMLFAMFVNQAVAFLKRPNVFPDVTLAVVGAISLLEAVIFQPIPDSCSVLWLIAMFWRQTGVSLQDDSSCLAKGAV